MCHLNFVHQRQSLGISKYRFFDVKKIKQWTVTKLKVAYTFPEYLFVIEKIINIKQGCHQFSCPETDLPTIQQEYFFFTIIKNYFIHFHWQESLCFDYYNQCIPGIKIQKLF